MEFDEDLYDDLVMRYVSVTLSDRPYYTTTFNLQNVQLKLNCGYNTRNKMRWVTITDRNGFIILSQTFLKYGKRCELNFLSNEYDLSYYLTLKPKNVTIKYDETYDYLNWAADFDMCFVGYSYSLVERLDRNGRIVLVGN